MSFCLPKEFSDKFTKSLKEGKIDPERLAEMTSEQRRTFFSDIVGKENAPEVNALFESKLLLKDYKRGLVAWAKKVAGLSEEARRDLVTRISKLDKLLNPTEERKFFEDLAAQKLGVEVSLEEAKKINDLSKEEQVARAKIDPNSPDGSPSRLEWGAKAEALQEYVRGLKSAGTRPTVTEVLGVAKSIKASIDNSFWLRQGWKTMFTDTTAWAKNFGKSWGDIAQGLKGNGDAVRSGVRADIISRKNALNGRYKKMKLDIGTGEEAYPTLLPEQIPVLGRFFKASDVAFESGAMRMRADIADRYLKLAEENGVDLTKPKEIESIGRLVNSLTGRGSLESIGIKGEAKLVNVLFFSPKLLKANFDFLTLHSLDPMTAFTRKQAAINLTKVVVGTAGILAVANALWPGSVETDPTSSDFGKIKIGNTRFDVSGGMASIVTLAARLAFGHTKSTTTGRTTELNARDKKGNIKFGAKTYSDVLLDFMGNKLSPAASVVKDLASGQMFGGGKPTLLKEAVNLTFPLPITNTYELMTTPGAANTLLAEMLDALGISTNTYGK